MTKRTYESGDTDHYCNGCISRHTRPGDEPCSICVDGSECIQEAPQHLVDQIEALRAQVQEQKEVISVLKSMNEQLEVKIESSKENPPDPMALMEQINVLTAMIAQARVDIVMGKKRVKEAEEKEKQYTDELVGLLKSLENLWKERQDA